MGLLDASVVDGLLDTSVSASVDGLVDSLVMRRLV